MKQIWQALKAHQQAVEHRGILDLFTDPRRAETFSTRLGDMLFDWSKTNIDHTARDLLIDLAGAAGVAEKREAMFSGRRSTRPRAGRCCIRRSATWTGRCRWTVST